MAESLAANQNVQIVCRYIIPNVSEPVNRILGHVENVVLIEPQDYLPLRLADEYARLILTDSGGTFIPQGRSAVIR